MNDKIKGLLSGVVATGAYGLLPLFAIPLRNGGMNVGSVLLFRFSIAALAIGIVILYQKINLHITMRELFIVTILALLNGGTGFLLVWSYTYLSSGIATVIHFAYPVVVALLMVIFFKEKFTLSIALSILLALIGVILVSGVISSDVEVSIVGVLIALASVITFSVYIVMVNKSGIKGMPTLKLNFYMTTIFSIVALISLSIFSEVNPVPSNLNAWTSVILFGVISTALPSVALVKAIEYLGSILTSIVGSCEPIVAAIVGVIVFHENLNYVNITGMILIIASVVVAMIFKKTET